MERMGESIHRKETRGPSRLGGRGIYCSGTVHLGMEKRARFHFTDRKGGVPLYRWKEELHGRGFLFNIWKSRFHLTDGYGGKKESLSIRRNDGRKYHFADRKKASGMVSLHSVHELFHSQVTKG